MWTCSLDHFISRVRDEGFFEAQDSATVAEWHSVHFQHLESEDAQGFALKFIRDQIRARHIKIKRIVTYLNPSLVIDAPIDIRLRRIGCVRPLTGLYIMDTLYTGEWDDARIIAYDLLPNGLCLYEREQVFQDFITSLHIEAIQRAAGENNLREIMRSQWVWLNWDTFLDIFQTDLTKTFGVSERLPRW